MTVIAPPRLGSVCRTVGKINVQGKLLAVVREPNTNVIYGVLDAESEYAVYSIGNYELITGTIPDTSFVLIEISKTRDITLLSKCTRLYFTSNGSDKGGIIWFRVFGIREDLKLCDVTHEIASMAYKCPTRYGIAGDNLEMCMRTMAKIGLEFPIEVLGREEFKPFFYRPQNQHLEQQFINLGCGYGSN